jgi:Tfp pilus assembly protein PilF
MTTAIIANLEKMLGGPRDSALLRYSLGNEWLKAGDAAKAVDCLRAAIEFDANYSAAWKLLGKALSEDGDITAALIAYENGITVAETKGDIQAAKEMGVFAKRLKKEMLIQGKSAV